MAKHCDVCNRDFSDELPACPHCAAAKHNPSDSAIDLGEGPRLAPGTGDAAGAEPAPLSGTSNVQWSSLVEEPDAEEVKVDSPSDADLLSQGAAGAANEPAHEPARPGSVSDSSVDLGASPVEEIEEGRPGQSDVLEAELASDANKVELVEEAEAELVTEEVKPGEDNGGGRDLIAEAVESGADPTRPEAELAEEVALDALEADDHSSAVDLGAPPPRTSHPEMSVVAPEDVVDVPEGSGIDLQGLPLPASDSASGSDSGSGPRSASESSVDLGSQEDVSLMGSLDDSGEAAVAGHSGIDVGEMKESALATGSDSDLSHSTASREGEAAEEDAATVEAEVDSLLADLEHTPAGAEEPAAIVAEEEAHQAAEAETAAATSAEAAKPAKPAKPSRPRSPALALSGAAAAGLVLGILGTLGVQMIGGGDSGKKTASIPSGPQPQNQPQPQAQAPMFADRLGHVRNGDFAKAAEAGIEQIQEDKPEELAARGSYRLGAYLQKTGLKVNLQDPPLQQAVADLQKAAELKNPDAIYDLGLINELANKLPEARKEYTKGVNDFSNDPVQKRRFQAALDRLDVKEAIGAAGVLLLPGPSRAEERAAVLALLLIGLQQAAAPAPAAGEEDEAGYDFWQAAKLARQRKFADAVRTLDKARTIHDRRRFTRLRKAQNPLSDPTEDIFLRCCDELKAYWQLEASLRDGGYLTDKNTVPQALDALVQKAQSGGAAMKELADKLIMEKIITRPEDLSKGIDRVLAEKKTAEQKSAALAMQLNKAKDDAASVANQLNTAKTSLKDRETQLTAVADSEKKLKAANAELGGTLKKITDELATAKLLAAGDQAHAAEAVRKAIDLAAAKDPQGQVRKLQDEAAQARAALNERWRPAELMPVWVLLLDQNRDDASLATKAVRDSDRVKADSAATPSQKGQAQLVRGLALRNSGQFTEAKTVLESARSMLDRGEWLSVANAALKEVSDPAAYYAARAEMLYAQGRMNAALELIGKAMPVLPAKDRARLLARRSLIELDAARAKSRGALSPAEPLLTAARKDADEAAKAGAAEGHYASGRIAEAQGQWNGAVASYRKALEGHPALDAEGSRYRMALARVLLQPRDTRPAAPAPPPAGGTKVGWSDPAPYPARTFNEMQRFALLVVLGLQAPLPPGDQPDAAEAEKLADEVLRAPEGSVPFNTRAQALAIKGRWTQALQLYATGIRPFLPPEYRDGLMFLILNHPRLSRPDSLRVANPFEAEKHFAAGVNLYFDGDFVYAEKELLLAVENDGQDARYYYFLGLARLAQSKRREAYRDFEEGAILEQLNRPSPAAVSEALERIQGPTRLLLNDLRERPER